jgi:hypothetical protein
VAWKALEYYADITPNLEQRGIIFTWLAKHPCPGEHVPEQMEMEL